MTAEPESISLSGHAPAEPPAPGPFLVPRLIPPTPMLPAPNMSTSVLTTTPPPSHPIPNTLPRTPPPDLTTTTLVGKRPVGTPGAANGQPNGDPETIQDDEDDEPQQKDDDDDDDVFVYVCITLVSLGRNMSERFCFFIYLFLFWILFSVGLTVWARALYPLVPFGGQVCREIHDGEPFLTPFCFLLGDFLCPCLILCY